MAKYRSSIFNFDTLSLKGAKVPPAAALAFLLVLGVEVGLHVLKDKLPDPVLWGNPETAAKVMQVEKRRDAARPVDVLILGASHATISISPQAISAAMGSPTCNIYNGALRGRTFTALEFMLEKVYLPALHPRMLLLGVNPVILNEYNKQFEDNYASLVSAPMPRILASTGLSAAWQRFLVENCFLYRYRHRANLRTGQIDPKAKLDDYGYIPSSTVFDDRQRKLLAAANHPYQEIMRRYRFSGPSVEALERILQRANERSIDVVVLNMPFLPEFLQISPTGPQDYQQYLAGLKHLQAKYGFQLLDYQAVMPFEDADFSDVDHLNTTGSRKLAARLAGDLQPVLTMRQVHAPNPSPASTGG